MLPKMIWSPQLEMFENGWRRTVSYFAMGLTETDEDIQASFPAVAKRILDIGREIGGKGVTVSASVAVSLSPVLHGHFSGWPDCEWKPSVDSSCSCPQITIGDSRLPTWNVPGRKVRFQRWAATILIDYRAWKMVVSLMHGPAEFNLDAWNAAAESLPLILQQKP